VLAMLAILKYKRKVKELRVKVTFNAERNV
jgi:hypothetical protein